MDADEVKNKFFDVVPPDNVAKPEQLNVPSRQVMVHDIIQPPQAVPEVHRETVVDPMLVQPKPGAVTETQSDTEPAVEPPEAAESQSSVIEVENIPPAADVQTDEIVVEIPDIPEQIVGNDQTESRQETVDLSDTAIDEGPKAVTPIDEDEAKEPETVSGDAIPEPQVSNTQTTVETPTEPSESPEAKDTIVTPSYSSVDSLPDKSEAAANSLKDDMQEPKIYDTSVYHVPIKETVHGHGGVKSALVFGLIFAIVVVGGLVFVIFKFGS